MTGHMGMETALMQQSESSLPACCTVPPGHPAGPACCCLPDGAQSAGDIIALKHASQRLNIWFKTFLKFLHTCVFFVCLFFSSKFYLFILFAFFKFKILKTILLARLITLISQCRC